MTAPRSDTRQPRKLIAAMSGGVDSSVAAYLMQQRGIELIGVTLSLKDPARIPGAKDSCAGKDDQRQAAEVCQKMGIPHTVLSYTDLFEEKVLKYAWNEYAAGRTPNPCLLCNRFLKFDQLHQFAEKQGADGIVTGHYVRLAVDQEGYPELLRGEDRRRDQSYFLMQVKAGQLLRSYFPLARYSKMEVREMARKIPLDNSEKPDSQDACFGLEGEPFAETLRRFFDQVEHPGKLQTKGGRIVGYHRGIHRFTLGQRRGIGVGLGAPAYVSGLDARSNLVEVTTDSSDLLTDEVRVNALNWLVPPEKIPSEGLVGQIRYGHRGSPLAAFKLKENELYLRFQEPQRAITPGQGLALYAGERLLGGGLIMETTKRTD